MRDAGTLYLMRTADGFTHHNAVRKRLLGATLKALTFLDDHRVMRDFGVAQETSWKLEGRPFHEALGPAHWTPERAYPASLTRGRRVRVLLDLAPDPIDADPIDVELRGEAIGLKVPGEPGSDVPVLTWEAKLRIGQEAVETVTLELESAEALPNDVFTIEQLFLRWSLRVAGDDLDLGSTGPHDLYVTYGSPDDGGRPQPGLAGSVPPDWLHASSVPLEDGLTHHRLREAVRATERLLAVVMTEKKEHYRDPETGLPPDSNDPHTIVRAILSICRSYTLSPNPSLSRYAHAGYMNREQTPVGGWPILEHHPQLAECQAIVRLVRAVAMAIGLPGQIELVVVYARPDVGGGKIALVDTMIPVDQDPEKYGSWSLSTGVLRTFGPGLNRGPERRAKDGAREYVALADSRVEVGEEIHGRVILNMYEACMRYAEGGRTRYYGGGLPRAALTTPEEVLHVFSQLVWVRTVERPDGVYRRVVEIVANYQDPTAR